MELHGSLLAAILLTTFAGLSTGIGSAIAFFAKRTNKTLLALSLGFSAGVMIYVSFVEIFQKAKDALLESYGVLTANGYAVFGFFIGIAVILIIDKLIPSYENPHEPRRVEEMDQAPENKKLLRMGLFTALAIAIHNFPEGLATFMAALTDLKIGASIAVAIAIHNIPEGIAVSIPLYYATGDKKKAFWLSFSSGLAEPAGGILGYLALSPFFNEFVYALLFSGVAGIMVFISIDELLPTAREYDLGHKSIYGLVAGMGVMAISLLFFL